MRPNARPIYCQAMRNVLVRISLLVTLGAGGCQQALFPKNAPRTQFEVHERMRNPYIQLEEPDEFGKPQPALRTRLLRRY